MSVTQTVCRPHSLSVPSSVPCECISTSAELSFTQVSDYPNVWDILKGYLDKQCCICNGVIKGKPKENRNPTRRSSLVSMRALHSWQLQWKAAFEHLPSDKQSLEGQDKNPYTRAHLGSAWLVKQDSKIKGLSE